MSIPTVETALQAIDRIAARTPGACRQMGAETMVPWRLLAFELFPRGGGGWKRPTGPHGHDRAPAVQFMDGLGQDIRIRVQYSGGQHFYGRRTNV